VDGENPPSVTTENRVQVYENSPETKWFNDISLNAHEKCGHLMAWENPEAVIQDIRGTINKVIVKHDNAECIEASVNISGFFPSHKKEILSFVKN